MEHPVEFRLESVVDAGAGSPCTIQDLPDEVMIYIFSFIANPSDLISLSEVCPAWHDLAYTPSLWKTKEYSCRGSYNADERNEILRCVPCLHSLRITTMTGMNLLEILESLKGRVLPVTELSVTGRGFETEFFREFADYFEGVEKLTIYDVKLRQEDYKNLGKLRSMSRVEICGDAISWTGLQTLLASCPNVSAVHVGVMRVESHDEEISLCETLSSMSTKLTTCRFLGDLELNDKVLLAMSNCHRLEEIEISDSNHIRGEGLVRGLVHLPVLKKLTLTYLCDVPSWPLNEFFRGMQSASHLLHLNLAACYNLDDGSLEIISRRCTNLQLLNIRACDYVTDNGIGYILDKCPKLQRLEMWGLTNLVGDAFHRYLPPSLPELVVIDFRYCTKVPVELLRALETKGRRVLW